MLRFLTLIAVFLLVAALVGVAVSALARAARDSRALVESVALETRRDGLQKVGYVALILVMLGVTSGLLGGM